MENGEEVDPFIFSRAVVCSGISSSLPAAALRLEEPGQAVDMEKALQQHQKYVQVSGSQPPLCSSLLIG